MFTILNRQINALTDIQATKAAGELETYVKRNFPTWAASKTEVEISGLCTSVTKTAATFGIYKKINLEVLLKCHIEFGAEMNEALKNILKNEKENETLKCERFYLALASERYKLRKITAL